MTGLDNNEPYSVGLANDGTSASYYSTSLSFQGDGSLHLVTEHASKDSVQVTWIFENSESVNKEDLTQKVKKMLSL